MVEKVKYTHDMNALQICPPHLSDVTTLLWEIQKSHFSTLLFIYFRLFTLSPKKTNSNCRTAVLVVYLLFTFNASYCLHSPSTVSGHTTGGAHGRVEACGSGLLRHGLNFSTVWCTTRLISFDKDWSHVLTQKVVTLNTCCDIACLTFQLPHITTTSFQSHRRQPTNGSFRSFKNLQSDKKVLQFTS